MSEEQRSEAAGSPTRVSQRVGVQEGCSAGRMPAGLHHGLLASDDDGPFSAEIDPTAIAAWRQFVSRVRRRIWLSEALDVAGWAAWLTVAVWVGLRATEYQLASLWPIVAFSAGVVAAARLAMTQARSERAVVELLERRAPAARNLFETTREILARRATTKPFVVYRVVRDAVSLARRIDVAGLIPLRRGLALAASGVAASVAIGLGGGSRADVAPASSTPSPSLLTHIEAIVTSPRYTGRPPAHSVDPTRLEAIEGSRIDLVVRGAADAIRVTTGDGVHAMTVAADGHFRFAATPRQTGYWTIDAARGDEHARRLVAVVLALDEPPRVHITAPGRDLLYSGGQPRIDVRVSASDDLALASLGLTYTKVVGSGERFEFIEGTVSAAVERSTPAQWSASAVLALGKLDVKPGDVLVYRAVARDARPGAPPVFSDAYFVEIGKGASATDAPLGLPADQDRFALSQQMIIVKTERLHARRGSMATEALAEDAASLAAEQRAVRTEFVFLMGEHAHVEDEVVEAEQSAEILAGRLENRGVKDLQDAIAAMTAAEQQLVATATGAALPLERKALEALQRAFHRSRYLLRAIPSRSRVDLSRRLAGNLQGARGWTRHPPDADLDPRAAAATAALEQLRALARELEATSERAPGAAPTTVRLKPDATTVGGERPAGGLKPDATTVGGERLAGGLKPDATTVGGERPAGGLKPDATTVGVERLAGGLKPDATTVGVERLAGGLKPDATTVGQSDRRAGARSLSETASALASQVLAVDPTSRELQGAADALAQLSRLADVQVPPAGTPAPLAAGTRAPLAAALARSVAALLPIAAHGRAEARTEPNRAADRLQGAWRESAPRLRSGQAPRLRSGQAPRLGSGQAPRLRSGQARRLGSGQAASPQVGRRGPR